jgi:prepilin-type N-terminal cleavage/methylation domain-containing protein
MSNDRRQTTCRFARPRETRARTGFTFVEILATVAIMAIVLPTVMAGISVALSASQSARRQAEASSLAHGKLSELVGNNQWQDMATEGDFKPDWPDYRWAAQLSTWDSGASQLNSGLQLGAIQQQQNTAQQQQNTALQLQYIEQLDVTVTWTQSGHDRSVTLSTLVNTANDSSGSGTGLTGVGP